jgi:transmembrane sensor
VHVEEYLGVALVASDLKAAVDDPQVPLEDLIAQARSEGSEDIVPLHFEAPPPKRVAPGLSALAGWSAAAVAAVGLGIIASVIWWAHVGELLGLPKTYRTGRGEQLVRQLPDHSELRLDSESRVTVRYSRTERLVQLGQGQALFRVEQDRLRPFRVVVGDFAAIALGTRFNVYHRLDSIIVTVAEGEVAVVAHTQPRFASGVPLPADARRVRAGYQLRIDRDGLPVQPMPVDLSQTLAWLEHKIAFERRPLGEVAEEFNRHGRVQIQIEDAALRALPVSGLFDLQDAESFAQFLATLDGVSVETTGTLIRVRRMVPTPSAMRLRGNGSAAQMACLVRARGVPRSGGE